MSPAIITLCVLAVVAILFITEIIPLAITSLGGSIALGLLGVIPEKQIFSGLSNSTVVLFAGMFVIGAALFHTGMAQDIGERVVRMCGSSETRLMFGVMVVTIVMSSVLSNTGTAASLIPVVTGICAVAKLKGSRFLMPMAIAANVGGTITMVGTPPNIIVTGALQQAGLPTFGFFEFAWIGVPLSIVTVLFTLTIGKKLLPKHDIDASAEVEQEIDAAEVKHDPRKKMISLLILVGVVLVMIFSKELGVSLTTAAIIGAIIAVLTGCMTEKQAYQSIDWVTIFLFAGMMPIATALDKSGAGALIANSVVGMLGDNPNPLVIAAVMYLLSNIMTQFMNNTATAALLCPLGISMAQAIGADPKAVLMCIAIAASAAFATPVATPPNTLVLGPGQYSFNDYLKVGIPLCLVGFITSMIIIPIVWPFFP